MEIEYGSLGYGTPTSIAVSEYYKKNGKLSATKRYRISGHTAANSTVTNTGGSIKFGDNASPCIGDTIYITIKIYFQ